MIPNSKNACPEIVRPKRIFMKWTPDLLLDLIVGGAEQLELVEQRSCLAAQLEADVLQVLRVQVVVLPDRDQCYYFETFFRQNKWRKTI
jgi:hypothetical protein